MGQDLVFILTLDIRVCGSKLINQVRLDGLAQWPSAKSQRTCAAHFFFFKHTKPDVTHVLRVDSWRAGRPVSIGDLCWAELESGLVPPARNQGELSPLQGRRLSEGAVLTRTLRARVGHRQLWVKGPILSLGFTG